MWNSILDGAYEDINTAEGSWSTVEPGDSKPVDSKQPGVSKLFTAYQPMYNINFQIDSKLLPTFERSKTWR